ncbi:MAG: adenylyl-sulfate kinase [bacterium]
MTNLRTGKKDGVCLWLTGLPSSGKTTVAKLAEKRLIDDDYRVERLDGDVVRQSLTADLGFSREDRDKNIARVAFVAKMLQRNEVITFSSFITPYRAQRDYVRNTINDVRIVYVNAPVDVCIERDPKGMYEKAQAGEIEGFTGIDAPYEQPVTPDLVLPTHEEDVEQSADRMIAYLQEEGFVKGYDLDVDEEIVGSEQSVSTG